MRIFPKIQIAAGFLLATVTLAGCTAEKDHFSAASYFDGRVLVNYQKSSSGWNDNITITFHEPGSYHIAFSRTPGKTFWPDDHMPKNFDATFDEVPRSRVIKELLPYYMRVTITLNGDKEEAHDLD